jgi:hypothetical protein
VLKDEGGLIFPIGFAYYATKLEAPLTGERETDPVVLQQGLSKVRQRRWILWATILIYIPGLLIVLDMQASSGTMAKMFALWLALICVSIGLATVVKCPRCNNTYHTNGPTFLPVRKCVHCGLHLNADKL